MENYSISAKTQEVVADYKTYVAGGFAPYPVALVRAKGAKAWDVDGKEYIDFLSMYSVVNMGHGHPEIVAAGVEAMEAGAVVNLPYHSPYYGKLAKLLHELFGYDKFVAMTSGAEAADAAVKIARKWGYVKKGIAKNQCHILTTTCCYHGITISTVSMASTKSSYYGPFVPQVGSISPSGHVVRYGEIADLRIALEADGNSIAAFMIEPIQGSAGIVVPPEGYLQQVASLCHAHNVLFICDEVQSGLGRAGANLCHLREGVRPDLVVLGKALAGGVYPLSGVMGDDDIMNIIENFEIGSTMAANPVGCAAALAALNVLMKEDLANRANQMGKLLISILEAAKLPHVKEFMGVGLFWAIVLVEDPPKVTPRRVVALLAQRGLLAGPAGSQRIRICPPLTIHEDEIVRGADIIIGAFRDIESMGELPGEAL